VFFLAALRGLNYGSIGSNPKFWLRKDTLEGDNDTLNTVLAYLTHSYQEIIETTYISNEKKITLQNAGFYLNIMGVITSFILFLVGYYLHLYAQYPFHCIAGMVLLVLVEAVFCYHLAKRY
jgi:hypothetical protein